MRNKVTCWTHKWVLFLLGLFAFLVLVFLASKGYRMLFERKMNNECNEIQCGLFLIVLSWIPYSTVGFSLSTYHKNHAKKNYTIQSYLSHENGIKYIFLGFIFFFSWPLTSVFLHIIMYLLSIKRRQSQCIL